MIYPSRLAAICLICIVCAIAFLTVDLINVGMGLTLPSQVHDILTSRAHMTGAAGGSGASGGGGGDGSEPAAFGVGAPGWLGYGPRPYGMSPMPPPPFGGSHLSPPTNITKL